MSSTALGAGAEKAQELIFISEAHEKFYYEKLKEVRYQDVYHKALCYWVALTYSKIKGAFAVKQGEKLCLVIAIGYGNTNGIAHSSKAVEEVSKANGNASEWLKKGVEASLLAPTAMNQQKYKFILDGNKVSAVCGNGFYTKIDLGIAKYHFELGAGKENVIWE